MKQQVDTYSLDLDECMRLHQNFYSDYKAPIKAKDKSILLKEEYEREKQMLKEIEEMKTAKDGRAEFTLILD